jgi:hypothetical protein
LRASRWAFLMPESLPWTPGEVRYFGAGVAMRVSPDYSRDFVAKARFPKRIADAPAARSEDERREARARRACSRGSRE